MNGRHQHPPGKPAPEPPPPPYRYGPQKFGPYGSDDPGRASRERHSREVHARLGRDARERMQRDDLKLTVAELMLWLHDQPGHATIRLNVRGQIALCEGHTLGTIDNDEPVVVLTGEEDPT